MQCKRCPKCSCDDDAIKHDTNCKAIQHTIKCNECAKEILSEEMIWDAEQATWIKV